MPIDLAKAINKMNEPANKICKLLGRSADETFSASIDTAATNKNRIVFNLSQDPNGFYSRVEIGLGKDGKLVRTMQNYIDNPAKDFINAHPFGYAQTEVID